MIGPFTGQPGRRRAEPATFRTDLRADLDAPDGYLPAPGLVTAVNAAMLLGQPLLLNGEPGTGKSGLAQAVAYELRLGDVLRVNCKADMRSSDLFYDFDHMRRLHDANAGASQPAAAYANPQGLGSAIMRAAGGDHRPAPLRGDGQSQPLAALFPEADLATPRQSVVLIDEIDKAPRDVPNDVLVELERMSFDLPEMAIRITADPARKPFVIITSNSEKALPAPFLRRCVFYSIPFPPLTARDAPEAQALPGLDAARVAYTMENIVIGRMSHLRGSVLLAEGLELFRLLRDATRFENLPSPSDFMNWLLYVRAAKPDDVHLRTIPDVVTGALPLLLKTDRDRLRGLRVVQDWLGGPPGNG